MVNWLKLQELTYHNLLFLSSIMVMIVLLLQVREKKWTDSELILELEKWNEDLFLELNLAFTLKGIYEMKIGARPISSDLNISRL